MIRSSAQKTVFLGCPLDCDEKHDAIAEKRAGEWPPDACDDPLETVTSLLQRRGALTGFWESAGSVDVPGWLRPFPAGESRDRVTAEDFVAFIDGDGCRDFADRVAELVATRVLPQFPCMVAVDHSLTGGAYRAVAGHYGREKLSLIVVDSHTDALPMSRVAGAIQYDIDNNPGSVYDRSDPLLYGRPDSYNASSFLQQMLLEGWLDPGNLYLLGVSDYPEKRSLRLKDPRIAEYVGVYRQLKRDGAHLVTKKECQLKPSKVRNLLNGIRTPYVYLSVDMDIGARNAVEGVRFKNWRGLSEKQIGRLMDVIAGAGGEDLRLVGMDITEINPRQAGRREGGSVERTYEIAADCIEKFALSR